MYCHSLVRAFLSHRGLGSMPSHHPVVFGELHWQHVQLPLVFLKSQFCKGQPAFEGCSLAMVVLLHCSWYPVLRSILAAGQ